MSKTGWISIFVLLMFVMMSACSGSPASKTEENAQTGTEKATQNAGTEATSTDNGSQDGSNPNATDQDGEKNNASQPSEEQTKDTSTSKATKGKFPLTVQVGQQQSHANGTSVFIENITFEDKYSKVQFEAVTNNDFVKLSDEFNPDVVLADDTGMLYTYIRPENNHGLEIPRDGKLSGTLMFFGRLNPDAKQLTLEFNAEERNFAENNKKNDTISHPYFKFVIDLAQERG